MPSLFVLIFALSMIACGDGDRQPENQSANPLYPSGPEQVQRGQIVPVEGSSVSEAEVVIIDAERLVVLARVPVDDQGSFVVSVPQRQSYWLGVSGPYMTTYIDTAFAFMGEAITVGEAPRSHAAGKAAQVVGILGDVNNDNQVDIADALLVLLYTLERFSFVAPNQGNIALGDVNEDGQIDIADVLLIMTYIANPLDPTLPDGIGLATDRERAVLVSLYWATGGANWENNTNWLINTYPLDQWYGVTTDDEGWVTELDLADNGLTGAVPEELGQLDSLRSLDLSGNQLAGTIPEALGQLENLDTLYLAANQLTGPIPEALGQLNNLKFLHLAGNQLTGPIPETLGQLENLEGLYLNFNQLTGPIPETLGQLNNLQVLWLSLNQLTGPIPETLGQLNNLQSLKLFGNQLTCIPSALRSIPNNDLDDLGLAFCHLESGEAAILAAFYEATGGDGWKNNTNWLSGAPLSEWYGVTTDDEGWVISLDLSGRVGLPYGDYPSGNGLRGTIPEALGQLNNLESLDFADNELTGPIPETLGQLNNLQALSLGGNELTGPIPETLGQLNNLQYLGLVLNELTGPIPETLGQLNNLQYLGLLGNQLTGPIPETLGQLNNLIFLTLARNQLTGPIPETLGQLNNLEFLDFAGNELTGPIPEALGQLNNLQYLYLSRNELTGCIPPALRDVPDNDLHALGLSFCQ